MGYISEPDRGRRRWKGRKEAQRATYANRRRIRGERGKERLRQRGELVERSFAHTLESGAMRRTWLRHHDNILKRYLVHVAAFNFGLVMRQMFGFGTPRGLAGLAHAIGLLLRVFFMTLHAQFARAARFGAPTILGARS